ncbi:MAG: potassium-transporting ATPase subunit KdpC [Acidiferrobacter sp.]
MWRETLGSALRFTILTWVLFGLGYPLLEVGINQLLFPAAANGSLIRIHGQVVGSRLIEERFSGAGWFHGRPSAVHDNPMTSGGSNLGPLSPQLFQHLVARRAALLRAHPTLAHRRLPADMITSSGSGLDPDISPANAALQAPWVARARHLPLAFVRQRVAQATRGPFLGLFGSARVNVVTLNLSLQAVAANPRYTGARSGS